MPQWCNHEGQRFSWLDTSKKQNTRSYWKVIVAILSSLAWTGGGSSREVAKFVDCVGGAKSTRFTADVEHTWFGCSRSPVAVPSLLVVAGRSDVWSGTDGCVPDLADLFLER